MSDLQVLQDRLEDHKAETAVHREAEKHERRDMRKVLSQLNENMIHLTSAVTEWKTRDIMFEQRLEKAEDKVESLLQTNHEVDLRLVKLEGITDRNSKANDTIAAVWLKITTGIIMLAVIGGLAYKLTGG